MNTLPTERDLPPAARDAARARAVAAVAPPPTRSRRWVPVAAAAAAVAVVGGSALAVSGRSPAPDPAATGPGPAVAATPTAARTVPPDAELTARCVRDAGGDPGRLRAVFSDARGYLVWVMGDDYGAVCAYRWDGSRDGDVDRGRLGPEEPDQPRTGYAPATGSHLTLSVRTRVIARSEPPRAQLVLLGQVARDVTRVEGRWAGRPPVEAALRGPYYLARVVAPLQDGRRPELRGSTTAYGPGGSPFHPIEFLE